MIRAMSIGLLLALAVATVSQAQTSYRQPTSAGQVPAMPASTSLSYGEWFSEPGAPSVAYKLQEPAASAESGQGGGGAGGGGGDTTKESQNPIANLVSLPIQNNWDFGLGPDELTQYVGLVQPVIPLKVNDRWNLITRPILPLINSPDGSVGREHGLGDMQWQNFFVPVPDQPSPITWGIGPSFVMPTASSPELGAQLWGAGISAVVVYSGGPVVGGVLANQNFIEGGVSKPFLIQPFFNYNFDSGILNQCFLAISGEFNADWEKETNQWTNVFGIGPGRAIKFLGQPMTVTTRFAPYLNSNTGGANWQFRLQLVALFPK